MESLPPFNEKDENDNDDDDDDNSNNNKQINKQITFFNNDNNIG